MKAHEQKWTLDIATGDITDSNGRRVATASRDATTSDEMLLSAAPDMARELMGAVHSRADIVRNADGEFMRLWLPVEQVAKMRDALRKAGVL